MAWSTADWWNAAYTYRAVISITAPGGENVPAGYSVELTLDTAVLLAAGKCLASRNDVRIVYWAGGVNTELDRHYVSAASTFFKIQAEIVAGATSTAYMVYYGNSSATAPSVTFSNVYLWGDDFEDGDMSGWTTSLGSGATLVASTTGAIDGTYSARLADTGTYASQWWHDYTATPTDAVVRAQAKLKIDYYSTRREGTIYCKSGATTLCYVWFHNNGNVYYYPGGTNLRTWADNTAYTVAIDIKPATDRADVYIDGVSEVSNGALYATCTATSRIMFSGIVGPLDFQYTDTVIVRRLMATAPAVTATDEAQLVTKSSTIQFDCGTTTVITKSSTITFDVWAATITKSSTIQFDLLNQITKSSTIQFDVLPFVWDGETHAVIMEPSQFTLTMEPSQHALVMAPSQFELDVVKREM